MPLEPPSQDQTFCSHHASPRPLWPTFQPWLLRVPYFKGGVCSSCNSHNCLGSVSQVIPQGRHQHADASSSKVGVELSTDSLQFYKTTDTRNKLEQCFNKVLRERSGCMWSASSRRGTTSFLLPGDAPAEATQARPGEWRGGGVMSWELGWWWWFDNGDALTSSGCWAMTWHSSP